MLFQFPWSIFWISADDFEFFLIIFNLNLNSTKPYLQTSDTFSINEWPMAKSMATFHPLACVYCDATSQTRLSVNQVINFEISQTKCHFQTYAYCDSWLAYNIPPWSGRLLSSSESTLDDCTPVLLLEAPSMSDD